MYRLGSGLAAGAFALLSASCGTTTRQPTNEAAHPRAIVEKATSPILPLRSEKSASASPSDAQRREPSRILLLRGDKSPYEVLSDDGTVLASLQLASGSDGGEWIGNVQPKLSPNEPLVAEIKEDGLWLRYFDGTAKQIVPESPEAWMTLAGWSPDGQTLLFHRELHSDLDDQPNVTPHGVTGFHLLHRKDYSVERLSRSIRGFEFWDADSQHIFSYDLAHLIRTDVHRGAKETLRECKCCFQLSHLGQQIVFSQTVPPCSVSQETKWALKKGSLLGNDETVLVEGEGGSEDYQWPKGSPNGGNIAFEHHGYIAFDHRRRRNKETIEVLANHPDAKPREIYECDMQNEHSECNLAAWMSEDALVVLNNGVAKKVTLGGEVTTLASNIAYVVSGY